jgi:hypothetical protein
MGDNQVYAYKNIYEGSKAAGTLLIVSRSYIVWETKLHPSLFVFFITTTGLLSVK